MNWRDNSDLAALASHSQDYIGLINVTAMFGSFMVAFLVLPSLFFKSKNEAKVMQGDDGMPLISMMFFVIGSLVVIFGNLFVINKLTKWGHTSPCRRHKLAHNTSYGSARCFPKCAEAERGARHPRSTVYEFLAWLDECSEEWKPWFQCQTCTRRIQIGIETCSVAMMVRWLILAHSILTTFPHKGPSLHKKQSHNDQDRFREDYGHIYVGFVWSLVMVVLVVTFVWLKRSGRVVRQSQVVCAASELLDEARCSCPAATSDV